MGSVSNYVWYIRLQECSHSYLDGTDDVEGDTMDTCRQAKKGKRAPFFVTEDPDCPAATAGKSIRQGQADAFMEFADAENVLVGSRDYDLEVTR